MEQFANFAVTTLNGTILSSALSLQVTLATAFPTTGNFRILVENEIMLVTGVLGTTFTVTRGQEGTTAANHNSGVLVTQIITKGALAGLHADIVQVNSYANRPTAGGGNALYIPTDGMVNFADDGTQWRPMIDGILGWEVAPGNNLVTAGFTNYNTLPTTGPNVVGGCPFIFHTSNGSTQNLCGYEVTKTAGQTLTCSFIPWPTPNAATGLGVAGIYARDSVGGHFQGFNLTESQTNATPVDSTNFLTVDNYTSGTVFSSEPVKRYSNFVGKGARIWFRIRDVAGTLNYDYSNDGVNWNTQYSDNTWVPSGGTRYGFYVSPFSQDSGITILSWKVA